MKRGGANAAWLANERSRGPTGGLRESTLPTTSPPTGAQYGRRLGIVEPVFGNLRYNKRLARFTLRGRTKVDGQWKLFALVHNIEKLANRRKAA
jgi:hypothetical protein